MSLAINVVDDFGYVCLDKDKEVISERRSSKHNVETSHAQRLKQ